MMLIRGHLIQKELEREEKTVPESGNIQHETAGAKSEVTEQEFFSKQCCRAFDV